jgi:hypothetical protein
MQASDHPAKGLGVALTGAFLSRGVLAIGRLVVTVCVCVCVCVVCVVVVDRVVGEYYYRCVEGGRDGQTQRRVNQMGRGARQHGISAAEGAPCLPCTHTANAAAASRAFLQHFFAHTIELACSRARASFLGKQEPSDAMRKTRLVRPARRDGEAASSGSRLG